MCFRFVFGADASESGAVLVDDSADADVAGIDESGLEAQGGIDNFSIDISQFADHHHQQQQPQIVPGSSCEPQSVVPVSGVEGDELLEEDISELHEEIDLDDDVDEDEVSVVEPTRHDMEGNHTKSIRNYSQTRLGHIQIQIIRDTFLAYFRPLPNVTFGDTGALVNDLSLLIIILKLMSSIFGILRLSANEFIVELAHVHFHLSIIDSCQYIYNQTSVHQPRSGPQNCGRC